MTTRPTALGGLRVLDLTNEMGWYAPKLLAELGADVLRLEPPSGDPGRRIPPFDSVSGESLAYLHFNTSKRARAIDLASTAGRDAFLDLACSADVVIETAQPGAMDALGIGYSTLSAANPALIWTSITPFGQNGPRAHWQATDIVGMALSGTLQIAGVPRRPPSHPDGHYAYHQAAMLGAVGTMTALLERDSSGRGQQVDVSMQESMIIALENTIGFVEMMGINRHRIGYRAFSGAPQVFPVKDGYMVGWLGRRWDAFVSWLNEYNAMPEEWNAPEYANQAYRDIKADEIQRKMLHFAGTLNREEVYAQSQKRRIANGPVVSIDELFDDPQLCGRDFWIDVERDGRPGTVLYPGAPYQLSKTPWKMSRPAPLPNEDLGVDWLSDWIKPAIGEPSNGLPLKGVRAIDFCWQIAGPVAGQILADHGAEVIKIESTVHPDGLRLMKIPRPVWTDSMNQVGTYNHYNTSKESVSIDLRTEDGRDLLKQLIKVSDVIIDNYGVDPFPKWGMDEESLRKIVPDLIIARSSVMGRTGPRSDYIGFGYAIAGTAGLNSHVGFPGEPPVGVCTAYPDFSCNPHHFVLAILAALRHRNKTGEGQLIDLSQHESTVILNGPALIDFTANDHVATPPSNRSLHMAPHGVFMCLGEDRWVALVCRSDDEWRVLASVIGRPELADDPRFATLDARKQNEDALDAEITRWTRRWTPAEAMHTLQEAGIPAGALSWMDDVRRDPHLNTRQQIRRVDHPELGTTLANGPGFRLSRTPNAMKRPPMIGEHTDTILAELLGLDEDTIAMGYVNEVLN